MAPQGQCRAARGKLGEQRRIVGRIGHDRDEIVVLGRRADHRRTADIDVLDAFLERRAARHGRLERVEIDHDDVDRRDPVHTHRCDMLGRIAARQDAAMDQRMQGLDPAVHHLREAGMGRHLDDLDARLGDRRGRAAGRQDLDTVPGEPLGELDQAGLVGNRDQGALRLDPGIIGHSSLRC
jgi:hypothetical protein